MNPCEQRYRRTYRRPSSHVHTDFRIAQKRIPTITRTQKLVVIIANSGNSDATDSNCANFLIWFSRYCAVFGFREKCVAWSRKNYIVHALPRLAEEDFAARAAFLSPDYWD